MTIILKLVWRDFCKHPALLLFTFLAIAAAACLATWFVASIDLNAMAEDNGTKDFYGKYTLALCANRQLNQDVAEKVHDIPGVVKTSFAMQMKADMKLLNFHGAEIPEGHGDLKSPHLMGMNDTESPFELSAGRWFQNVGECVVGTAAEQILTQAPKYDRKIALGDIIQIETPYGKEKLTVVGLVKQDVRKNITRNRGAKTFSFGFGLGFGGGMKPKTQEQLDKDAEDRRQGAVDKRHAKYKPQPLKPAPNQPSVYVSLGDAVRLASTPSDVNIMFVQLEKPEQVDDFYRQLEDQCRMPLADLRIRTADTKKRPADTKRMIAQGQTTAAVVGQAWSTIGIVILASVFIIFTTLSLGVTDKTRQLAMLRTIGFTPAQVASIIILEGLLLGILGWLGGVAAGWCLVTLTIYLETNILPLVSLSPGALLFALLCSAAGALAAAIIPAWKAAHIPPADAMPQRFQRFSPRQIAGACLIGLALLVLVPAFVFCQSLDLKLRFLLFTTVGTLVLGAAFLCLIPAAAVLTEKIAGAAVAVALRLNPTFLKQLITGNQWRTMGTTVSLSIGLGLFTAVYIWSYSMLSMFTVTEETPDFILRFHENILSPETTQDFLNLPEIKGQQVMELAVAQPNFNPQLSARILKRGAFDANTVCLGINPDLAWNDENPMVKLKFVQGSPQQAREAFKAPNARVCVIPESLAHNAGLKLGDTIQLMKPTTPQRPKPIRGLPLPPDPKATYADYQVVGIVTYPWTWFSKCACVRVSVTKTAAVIFTPFDATIQDFKAMPGEFFWFNAKVSHDKLQDEVRDIAARRFEDFKQQHPEQQEAAGYSGGTRWDSGLNKRHVVLNSRESLNNSLNGHALNVIDTMAKMPIVMLVIASIAVVSTIMVSVRARTWEWGVLRACGLTRWQLARLVVAEASLIAICAWAVSFAFGLYYAWLTTQMADLAPVFGVIAPPLTIPWSKLLPGYLMTAVLAVLAALYPAIAIGNKPLEQLLQQRNH